GVDEAERLELVALVDVGDAGAGQLEQRLRERDPLPEGGEPAGERGDEVVLRAGELLDAALVRDVGREPARAPPARAERPLRVAVEPLAGERPGADERLPDEVRVVRVDA